MKPADRQALEAWFAEPPRHGTLNPTWWDTAVSRAADPPYAAILHVESARHGLVVSLNVEHPDFAKQDWLALLRDEALPRWERLRSDGPEPDGWNEARPGGPWQLWLRYRDLPYLDE